MSFKTGDHVYIGDWGEGIVVQVYSEDCQAIVEFETGNGGGRLPFDFEELKHIPERKATMTEETNANVSFQLIPNWREQNLRCHFCGETRSVKYAMKVHDPVVDDQIVNICVCNKCVLLNANKEVKHE